MQQRTRRLVGVVSLAALIVIGIGVAGPELPLPRFGGGPPEPSLSGVRALATTPLVRVGAEAPAGGELAFIAVEPSGNLLVTDRQRQSVLRFDASGHLLSEWGPRLSSDVAIEEPAGIATDGNLVYVLDRGKPRIFVLDSSGRLEDTISLESLGTYGLNGLTLGPDGNLYAADTGRNRILVLSPRGGLLRQIGSSGSGLGELTQPMAVGFGPDGSYAVADWENGRVQRFDTSNSAVESWQTGFRPFGIAVDGDGRVYAPDADRRRVFAYTPRGEVLAELGAPGSPAIDVAPRQLATSDSQPLSLYVLGGQGIVRLDLEAAPAPATVRGSGDDSFDLLGPLLMVVLAGIPIAALLARRRRSVRPTARGEVGLQPENGAQR